VCPVYRKSESKTKISANGYMREVTGIGRKQRKGRERNIHVKKARENKREREREARKGKRNRHAHRAEAQEAPRVRCYQATLGWTTLLSAAARISRMSSHV
jgi:hypothetical protein